MDSKRTKPAPASTRESTASRGRRVPNPFPPATQRLAKRLLQFAELLEPARTRAYNTWRNSAVTPPAQRHRRSPPHPESPPTSPIGGAPGSFAGLAQLPFCIATWNRVMMSR